MKYPVIFKTFSVLFSLQSDERWIVPIFGGTIILLLAFSAWRLCTEKKDKWRYRRMMLLSLILWGVGELLWQVNVSQIMIISSILAIGYVWIFAQSEKIQCTPNLDENAIVIRSKNMCISNVTTKFGNLALSSMDYRSCHLNIVEYGTEYVRIDYTNKQKQQKFTVFEIVVSPYNLVVISQFDEVGNQINFSTY